MISGEVLYGRGDAVFVSKQPVGVLSRPDRREVDGNRLQEAVSAGLKLDGPEATQLTLASIEQRHPDLIATFSINSADLARCELTSIRATCDMSR